MTNTLGINTVILDSDALIGLINETDALHGRCTEIAYFLAENSWSTIIPYSIVLEAATAISRDKIASRPDLASELLWDNISREQDSKINQEVSEDVAKLYNPKTSKKNTPFDHYVLALAKKNKIKYVFSFDSFYAKNGLTLAEDLIKEK